MNNPPRFIARPHIAPTLLVRPAFSLPAVKLSDPAISVMTDFRQEHPVTVGEDRTIDGALGDMLRSGVGALLVVRAEEVRGLISTHDIQGERLQQFMRSRAPGQREDVRVGDIMTACDELPALEWATVRHASVGDLLEIFQRTGCSHLVVLETYVDRPTLMCGLVSSTRLHHQLSG